MHFFHVVTKSESGFHSVNLFFSYIFNESFIVQISEIALILVGIGIISVFCSLFTSKAASSCFCSRADYCADVYLWMTNLNVCSLS